MVQNDVSTAEQAEQVAPTEDVVDEHKFPAEEDWEKGTD